MMYTVYKIDAPDGTTEYRAFSEAFLTDPYVTGSCVFEWTFLPLNGRKYVQDLLADNEKEAVEIAKKWPWAWRWSKYNWGREDDEPKNEPEPLCPLSYIRMTQ